MGLLDGKVAIITGAGRGIGREHALAFAKEGAKVVVNDFGCARDGAGADESPAALVVKEIEQLGGVAAANFDSVATSSGAQNIIKTALDKFGRVDILVNNAGILRDKTMLKLEEEMWDIVIAVHLKGTFLCAKAAAIAMRDQGTGGRIINTTSVAGLLGNFGQTNYGSAKAGIYGFTRVASLELVKYGITVNAIAPIALTRLTEDLPMFQEKEIAEQLKPEHISPIVVYLASDLSSDINGKTFGVQGGRIFQYFMQVTDGVTKDVAKEGPWTPQEIHNRIQDILKA